MIVYIFDLIGTFAFALVGAQFALRHRLNLLGTIIFASITAVGGGTLRELMLHHIPFYLYNYTYLIMILAAAGMALTLPKRWPDMRQLVPFLEALGTVTFAFNGAHAALAAGLGLPATILFAGLTAFGGGVLCEIIVRQTPRIFSSAFCTLPSVALGGFYWWAGDGLNDPRTVALLVAAFSAQLCLLQRFRFMRTWRRTVKLFYRRRAIFVQRM